MSIQACLSLPLMSELGNRIKGRRAELGLTQKDLADACQVKQASVSAWERGDTLGVRPENLYLAAKKLRTSMEWLTTGKDSFKKFEIAESGGVYQATAKRIEGRQIPKVPDWKIESIHKSNKKIDMDDSESSVATAKEVGPRAYALQISSDVMEPTFPQGATVIVDPDYPAEHGAYVIAEIEGEPDAIFKQLIVEAGHKYLRSLNARYPVVIYNEEKIRICGVVRQMLMDFD